MKRYIDYLFESSEEKKYLFKIKIAGQLPDNCEDCMETALQKFKVCRFTKGKSSPIQETLLDFPDIKNSEITVFETEVEYPATSAVITELISQATGIPVNCIRVRTPQEEANWEIENQSAADNSKSKKPLLQQEYEKSDVKDLVGEKFVSNFLKELAKARKNTEPSQYKGTNDAILAKKLHKDTESSMISNPGPARSVLGGRSKD